MSNYLCNLGWAVGFAGDNEDMDPPPTQRETDWDLVSNHSRSQGNVNLLHHEGGQQGGGNDQGQNNDHNSLGPTQRGRQPPEGGLGGIPGAINNNNALDIQSNLSMGGEFDQGMVRGGQGQQPVRQMPGGEIMARIQAVTSCHDNTTIERELDRQART